LDKSHPTPSGVVFLFASDSGGIRTNLNATVQWTVACRQLDGGNTLIKSNPSSNNAQTTPFGVVFFLPIIGRHSLPFML
jgi:hypothetical protein